MLRPKSSQSSFYDSYIYDRIIPRDHLSGTSLVTSDNGTSLGNMKYYAFGICRNSPENFPTDKLFTGQRLDDTGLYYYNARYYDATIGRFISADTIVPNPANPQAFNRYSYCLNNPLKYVDPSGNDVEVNGTNYEEVVAAMNSYDYMRLCMLLSDPDMQDFIRLSIAAPELSNMMIASTYLFDITKIDFGSDKSGLPYVFVDVYTDLRDESIPVTYAPEGTFSAWVLHGIGMGAISFDPFRAAILYDGASSDWLGKTTREECFHRWDLWYTDPSNIIRYFTELKRLRDYYGSWNKAYGYSVYEQRAKVYAGFLSVLDVKLVPANDPWDYNYWPFWHSGIFRV